jgi:hypothetical protein
MKNKRDISNSVRELDHLKPSQSSSGPIFDPADTLHDLGHVGQENFSSPIIVRAFSAGVKVSETFILGLFAATLEVLHDARLRREVKNSRPLKPPFNAEYLLYLFLRKEERDVVIGDLIEDYFRVLERFNKRYADIWFYKQVIGSLFPLLRRAVLKIGALVWLGRILRRLIS